MRKAFLSVIISSLIILPLANVLAVGTDYRYTGKPYDANTNLYYYGQRYYDPNIGRFTQTDPVANNLSNPQKLKQSTGQDLQRYLTNPQNLNNYSYTQNNPVKYTDPDGEYILTVVGATVGGIGGMAYSYKNVGSFFKNVFRGDLSAASDDAEAFLSTGGKGALLGVSIGMVGDTVWGLVGLAKMSSPTWQSNNVSKGEIKFRYTQTDAKQHFSSKPDVPKFFQNRPIDVVANEIREDHSLINLVPVKYIERDGYRLIVNTRSALTLEKAGINPSQWNWYQVTDSKTINDINNRLLRNQLPENGTDVIKY